MIVQCKCECGTEFEEYNKWGRKREYVYGHNRKGKTVSDATRQLMSENHADNSGENNSFYGKTHSPKSKQKISENRKGKCCGENNSNYGKHPSPETKQLMSIINSGENNPFFGKHHSPKNRQLISDNNKGKIYSPESRQLMSDNNRGENNPMYGRCGENNPNYGKTHSPETRQLISNANSGENHPNWKGGISKEPYCQEWDGWLKEEIKERDNFQCQNPDCDKEITKTNQLCIHHINYVKKDCSANNLITICRSCNNRANHNREHWQKFYNKRVK